jgi:hypothetical protein
MLKFSSYFITGLGLGLLLAGLYNYKVDRWGVFSDDYRSFYSGYHPNYRYLKTKYLLRDAPPYDCLVMGSSRVAVLDADLLGPGCYNFTESGGTPVQHLHQLKLFLEAGLPIEKLYIGVDELSFTWDNSANDEQYDRRGYPANLLQRLRFYAMYLLRLPDEDDLEILSGRIRKTDQPDWVLTRGLGSAAIARSTGEKLYQQAEEQREKFRQLSATIWHQQRNVDQVLVALEDMLELAETHDIDVTIFFNPVHYKTWLATDWDALYEFKRRLALLRPYYDFGGYNPVTADDRYWLETSHYTTVAGDAMIAVLLGQPPAIPGFGRHLTATQTEAAYELDLADALALYPGILEEQQGINLPVPVAETLIVGMQVENLLDEGRGYGIRTSPGVLLESEEGDITVRARRSDPQLRFAIDNIDPGQFAIIYAELDTPRSGWVELFQRLHGESYRRGSRASLFTRGGSSRLYFPVLPTREVDELRFDPGRGPGQYRLRALNLYRSE